MYAKNTQKTRLYKIYIVPVINVDIKFSAHDAFLE